MRTLRFTCFLLFLPVLLLAFVRPSLAQVQSFTGSGGGIGSTLDKVQVGVKARFDTVQAGAEAQFAIVMDIEEGWHLNAHSPTLDYLVGVDLNVEASDIAIVSDIRYPQPLQMKFDFANDILDVYEGRSIILLKMKTSKELQAGVHDLSADLQIQACSDNICLPPARVKVDLPLNTGHRDIPSEHTELFEELENRQAALSAAGNNQIATMFSEQGYFWAFISIFFIGLALNLTPCVYPMMSVTVSLFGGQNREGTTTRSAFSHALVYVLGIVSMYSVLGAMAAWTGGLFGSWLQSPWVLAGIGVLIFALSLSMFGLYELQPPSWLMQKLGKTQQTAGYVGHFLSGLLVGVFAAPCIGPPIIALLAFVGAQGSPLFGFFSFFIMAFGLGIPYLFLGTFSGLLNKMPKSGGWMIWVKKLFGVVLVGVALFYLSLAFMPGYSMHVILITVLLGGLYLGFIERSGNDRTIFRRVKRAAGVGALAAGLMLFQNLQKDTVEWTPYDPALVEQAQQAGQPVMLDFYADWCIPCIELERITYTDAAVIDQTAGFMRLKVDLTHFDSEHAEKLRRQYKIAGVPTILFLGPGGDEVEQARVVGFISPEAFLKKVSLVEDLLQ